MANEQNDLGVCFILQMGHKFQPKKLCTIYHTITIGKYIGTNFGVRLSKTAFTVDYLEGLSDVQLKAVTTTQGPALIIAGAGSGKTRVLTVRIAHLLKQGVPPGSILALTFTNKAAKEMKERIARVVGNETARGLWMGTFHSMFMRILRIESERVGYPKTFTIYDTSDSKSLITSIIKELKLDTQTYKVGDVFGRISSAKNNLITPQAYAANTSLVAYDRQTRKAEVSRIYALYVQRCRSSFAMDFDDLLMLTNILFRDFPDVLAKYQHRFQYILVDEYQDTNYSQYLIVKRLSEHHQNVCVVGDDAQSIYSFRGAKIENILNFRNDYPNYNLFKLEQNYRSTQTIVNAANSIIEKNRKQLQKVAYSAKDEGERIGILKAYTDQEEGFLVASSILDTKEKHNAHYKDFAILYRTNAQSRIFEESLRKRAIPYRVYGSLSFYQRKEIKDLLAYFRLAINPNDDEALKRIINYPARGIGATTLDRVEADAAMKDQSIWLTIDALSVTPGEHKPAAITKLHSFQTMIKSFSQMAFTADAYEAAYAIAKGSGVLTDLKADKSFEGVARLQNVEELLNGIKEFMESQRKEGVAETVTLPDYLENVSLLTDADTDRNEDKDKVALMTIHSAKGLEFDYVFLAGVEEELFPSRMTLATADELEEERRLFYVAITRAARRATISYAQVRFKWGNLTTSVPSRFIDEIDPKYVDFPTEERKDEVKIPRGMDRISDWMGGGREDRPMGYKGNSTPQHEQPRLKPMAKVQDTHLPCSECNPDGIRSGMVVQHERFGQGKVVELEGIGSDRKAIIEFQAAGHKKLLLKFAKLRVVG